MLGVQGRTTTVNGARISAAMYHAPLFHESGRRGEAERVRRKKWRLLSSGFLDFLRFFSVKGKVKQWVAELGQTSWCFLFIDHWLSNHPRTTTQAQKAWTKSFLFLPPTCTLLAFLCAVIWWTMRHFFTWWTYKTNYSCFSHYKNSWSYNLQLQTFKNCDFLLNSVFWRIFFTNSNKGKILFLLFSIWQFFVKILWFKQ